MEGSGSVKNNYGSESGLQKAQNRKDPDPEHWQAVLRIHDILVWIRIRGSMPLTNGSGFGGGSG
jgi:hypothetical protein